MSWGHKEQRTWSLVRRGLLANVSVGVSVTTDWLSSALVAGKWFLYTTAQWPWPSRSDRGLPWVPPVPGLDREYPIQSWMGGTLPHPDLRWGTPLPRKCEQIENITFRHPSDVGGKYIGMAPAPATSAGSAPANHVLHSISGSLIPGRFFFFLFSHYKKKRDLIIE